MHYLDSANPSKQDDERTTMATDATYNGWTNYPTWVIKLWIDNDQGTQEMAYDLARRAGDKEFPKVELMRELQSWIESDNPLGQDASVYADLIGWAIESANWYELAEAFLDDVRDAA